MRNSYSNELYRCTTVWKSVFLLVGAVLAVDFALAEEKSETPDTPTEQTETSPSTVAATDEPEKISPEIAALYEKYGAYCDAIVDDARERRYALKLREIEAAAAKLGEQAEAVEMQSAALKNWVTRREEFAKQATTKIVEIYANMRPEASASRLQKLDINLAASILLAISPRQASPILNEMDEKSAATITAVMAASARMDDPS